MRKSRQQLGLKILLYAILITFILLIWFPDPFGNYCARTPPTPRPIVASNISIQHLWTQCAGIFAHASGILIHNDAVIFGDFYRDTLSALDVQTGKQHWQMSLEAHFPLQLDQERQRIYTHTMYPMLREIYAIDANSGEVVWFNNSYKNSGSIINPILLTHDKLIAMGMSEVRQINIDTGEIGAAINLYAYQVFRGGYAWLIRDGYLTAIDAITGNTYWQAVEVSPTSCCLRAVQTNDGVVIAIFDSSFTVYDQLSHEIRWKNSDNKRVYYPTLTEATVYTLDIHGSLRALDIFDGTEIGYVNFEPPAPGHEGHSSDGIGSSQLVADDNHLAIFFGDTDMLSVYHITLPPSN